MQNGNDRLQSALAWLASDDLPRGVPIPRTGKRRHHKYYNGSGVSANSRVLAHHYADEGDKGTALRREIRRKERVQWQRDWSQEMTKLDETISVGDTVYYRENGEWDSGTVLDIDQDHLNPNDVWYEIRWDADFAIGYHLQDEIAKLHSK
jgi:hypothetical protein